MSERTVNLVLDLPAELICEVLCAWLYIPDLVRLDSSYCIRKNRDIFKALYEQPEFVCSLHRCPRRFILWLLQRSIRLRNFNACAEVPEDIALKYLVKFGKFVQSVKVSTGASKSLVYATAKHCLHVKHLEINREISVSYELLTAFRNIESLDLYDASYATGSFWPTRSSDAFPHLRKLKIAWTDIESERLASLAEMCPRLTHLSLECYHISPDQSTISVLFRLPTLIALNVNGLDVDDSNLALIVKGCPLIEHLDLSYYNQITDDGLFTVATQLPLKSICLSNANQITDKSLKHLRHCIKTLRHLHISQSVGFVNKTNKLTLYAIQSLLSQIPKCTYTWRARVLAHDCDLCACSNATTIVVSTVLTDALLIEIAQNCTCLESLNIYLASVETEQYTSAGLYAVINSCASLKTIVVDEKFDKLRFADVLTSHRMLFTSSPIHAYDVMEFA